MRVYRHVIAGTALVALLSALPIDSAAQEEPDANEQFERAGRYVRRGQLDRAIELYEELSRQLPDWADVWFNLGEVSRVAEHPADCVRYFRRYLYLVPDEGERAQLEQVIDHCAADMSDSGLLEVIALPDRARITVDGIELAEGTLAPLPLAPGPHEVFVEAPDYVPQTLSITVLSGQTVQESVALEAVVHYGTLRISCNEDGATISIEDDVVGETPWLEPIRLVADNRYLVRLTKEGFYDWVRRVEIPADEESVLDVEMQEVDPWEHP